MDDAKAKELIKEHIFYEVWMLGVTRERLAIVGNDKKTTNTLLESYAVHARNLNEFFLENGKADTLKASGFTTANYRKPDWTEERNAPFKKINKQIQHLTRERSTVLAEKVNGADLERIYQILWRDLQNFDRHLKPELRASWGIIFGVVNKKGE